VSTDGPVLEVRDLSTWFDTPRGTVRAVDGVSLTLDRGRTLGIVGESGCGKTVLARSIMNLLPKRAAVPAGGEVLLEGRPIRGLGIKEMRKLWGVELAMVFQDPMTSLNPVVKIGQQLTEGLHEHFDMKGRDARAMAVELLRSVGLPAPERRLDEYPHQLSGGMRQRVTVAIALSCGPRLLIADEPTTALDVTVQRQILDLLEDQQRQRHMAMILVTHDLGVVANRTDEIAVMYAGQVVERAPTTTLFRHMRHPYTEALLGSIPRLEYPSHTPLQVIPGRPPDLAGPPAGCRFAPRCRYAQDRCLTEEPPLLPVDDPVELARLRGTGSDPAVTGGHVHRCLFPVGTDAGKEALARNVAEGRTAAGMPLTAEGVVDLLVTLDTGVAEPVPTAGTDAATDADDEDGADATGDPADAAPVSDGQAVR
jgi:peptide/nickel transport system ATP-binding protein